MRRRYPLSGASLLYQIGGECLSDRVDVLETCLTFSMPSTGKTLYHCSCGFSSDLLTEAMDHVASLTKDQLDEHIILAEMNR